MQQTIKILADKRMSLDFALRKSFTSYQFVKFFANEESKLPDELEVWFSAKCSENYKWFLEESVRKVIEEEFGVILKRGAVVQTKTHSFPIVFINGEYNEDGKPVPVDLVVQTLLSNDTNHKNKSQMCIYINGWRIYNLRRSGQWKIWQRYDGQYHLTTTVDTHEQALSFAENNLTEVAKRELTANKKEYENVV